MTTIVKVRIKDRWYTVEVGDLNSDPIEVMVDGELVEVGLDKSSLMDSDQDEGQGVTAPRAPATKKVFEAPILGVIVSVSVKVGDQIVTGDEVCVLEAMKMQQILRADWSGIVKEVHVRPGQEVQSGDTIVELE